MSRKHPRRRYAPPREEWQQRSAPMRPSPGQKCRRCLRPIEENRVRLRIAPAYVASWLGPQHRDPAFVAETIGRLQDASGTNSWWGMYPTYCNACTLTLNLRREPGHRHGGHPRRDRRAPAMGRRA